MTTTPKTARPLHKLTPRQQAFVESYTSNVGNATQAARDAGYAEKGAGHAGHHLLKNPTVKNALMEARKDPITKLSHNIHSAMQEASDAMDFAKETENANAYVKAVELRAKLNGLLTEKLDVRALAGFSVNILGVNRGSDEPTDKD